jgi:hypothetical protein
MCLASCLSNILPVNYKFDQMKAFFKIYNYQPIPAKLFCGVNPRGPSATVGKMNR